MQQKLCSKPEPSAKRRGAPPLLRFNEETIDLVTKANLINLSPEKIASQFTKRIHHNTIRNKMLLRSGWASREEFVEFRKIVNNATSKLLKTMGK
jgi:hypothetical protein